MANKKRNVLKLAPDAIVFINGERYVPVGNARSSKNTHNLVTQISINATIDASPNSASIELADPRTGDEPFFLNDSLTTLAPFSEVEILMKGRFTHGGTPAYYPVFWGLVSGVTKSFSGGYHAFQIECLDMLRWFEIASTNVHPSLIDAAILPGVEPTVFVNRFFNLNPFEIIYLCTKLSLENLYPSFGKIDRTQGVENDKQTSKYEGDNTELIKHWHDRFTTLGTMVRCVGMDGVVLQEDAVTGKHVRETRGDPMQPEEGTESIDPALDYARFDPDTADILKYRPYHMLGGAGVLIESEYRSVLDIVSEVTNLIGYEFFQDVTGEIIFKPPFWNMHTKTNKPVSVIEDLDVISWSTTDSEREVQATRMDVFGSLSTFTSQSESKLGKPRATAIDYKLAMQFGIRSMTRMSSFWRTSQAAFDYGATEMDKMNMRRFSSSLVIPLRPELRLGYPIFVEGQNAYHYIYGLTHTIDFEGMQASTQLTLVATRRCFRPLTKSSADTEFDNKTGNDETGLKGQAMVLAGKSKPTLVRSTVTSGNNVASHKQKPPDKVKADALNKINHKHTNMENERKLASGPDEITETTHPVSDEYGYEVQGCFRYGRGIDVTSRGELGKVTSGHSFEDYSPTDIQDNPALPPIDDISSRTEDKYDPTNPSNPGPRSLKFDGVKPGG